MVLTNLELIEVKYSDDMKKATLTFLDEERGEIREVNFNKQVYDTATGKFVDDPEKAEKVEAWSQEYFGESFDGLTKGLGMRHDVYAYDTFNSLWEVSQIKKFEEDMLNQIIEVECKEVLDDGNAVKIRFEYDGDMYESKMGYSDYNEPRKQWFVNPQKKDKQYKKFEDKFGISINDKEDLVGKNLMVEVKKAMGKYIYSEIKPFPKKKK